MLDTNYLQTEFSIGLQQPQMEQSKYNKFYHTHKDPSSIFRLPFYNHDNQLDAKTDATAAGTSEGH
jgi:hypothetical protein